MNRIELRQNYENYERVGKAFKDFIHALVWESMDIDVGCEETDVNEHIERYCNTNGGQMIALMNDSVTKFVKSLELRYHLTLMQKDYEGFIITDSIENIKTDNLTLILKKAAEFYRTAVRPRVTIFDKELNKYIVEWE